MMKKVVECVKVLPIVFMLLPCLTACGDSDSNGSLVSPEQDDDRHPNDKVFGPITNFTMHGKSMNLYWNEVGKSGAGMVRGAPKSRPILITGDEVIHWLDQNHNGESVINQYVKTFKPGNFSALDVILYASQNRKVEICQRWNKPDDCDVNVSHSWNPERRTHSISVNGENNWNISYDYGNGKETDAGFWKLEFTPYIRSDELLVKDEMELGFGPYDIADLEPSWEAQREEIELLERNEGKVIIPEIRVQSKMRPDSRLDIKKEFISGYAEDGWTPIIVESESEAAKDDNGLPMYVHGYYTPSSEFVSCGIEAEGCYSVDTDYVIKDLVVTPKNLRPDYYYDGVVTFSDLVLSLNDRVGHSSEMIFWPELDTEAVVNTYAINAIDGLYSSGYFGWNYNWTHKRLWKNSNPFTYSPHVMPDLVVLGNPDLVTFMYISMYDAFYNIQEFIAYDSSDPYKNTRENILSPKAPLTSSHFGYKVADCSQCHSSNDMSFDNHRYFANASNLEPAKCAECHGSNGAPKGHGQKAACYRCHFDMVGHGKATTENRSAHIHEKTGIGVSSTMPDPYACVSCHYNESDVLVGGK